MQRYTILWADDEINLLKAHIMFLESKGYDVSPVNSGVEALEEIKKKNFDCVFLDENMPGMPGLAVLSEIKIIKPSLPVIMITKSEEEHIMEEAIGSKIADYLIKPINPNQILMSLKKVLHNNQIVSEKINAKYRDDFMELSSRYNDCKNFEDWVDIYKTLVRYDLDIERTDQKSMKEVFLSQKKEANANFSSFIANEYPKWFDSEENRPMLSHEIIRKKTYNLLKKGEKVFFILVDNLRYDQWLELQPYITKYMKVEKEEVYSALLPTTTAYARNSIFSGLLPIDIVKQHRSYWTYEDEEGSKNQFEGELLGEQLKRLRLDLPYSFNKIFSNEQGKQYVSTLKNLEKNNLNAVVFNFVDMLSHARTDMAMIRELASDDAAYRSLTKSWFEHSPLFDLIKELSKTDYKIILTTDHGTVKVDKPIKIIGDRKTTTNLRYKAGKSLSFSSKDAVVFNDPSKIGLPSRNVSTRYVFAKEDYFFAYPNNYNHYVKYYTDTFQHGGISLEEMICPLITMSKK